MKPLTLILLLLPALFAQKEAPAQTASPGAPVIEVQGQKFYTWQDYTSSSLFRSAGLRCNTPPLDPVIASQKGASDCAYGSTNPTAEYAPTYLYDIPVVVHVLERTTGTGHLTEAKVRSQIDVLNEDYRALAGSLGAAGFDGMIRFHLATEDPSGNPTNGITYSVNNTWYNDGGSYYNTLAWDTNRYLNIYTNSAGGYLGYVPDLPQGGIVGSNSDRVVVLYSSFGRNGSIGPPYNKGRTTTHEVGHYLGLWHPFDGGCGTSSCYTTGDRICDTNRESSPVYGCPGSSSSCSSSDPYHNYMDYSDDTCMYEFTEEQVRRMRCTLQHWRPNLATVSVCNPTYNAGCAGSGGIVPTLSFGGCATGGSTITLNIGSGLGGAASFLFLGLAQATIPMPSGCILSVYPIIGSPVGPLPLSGSGAGNGSFSMDIVVPSAAGSGSLMAQAFVDDAGAANGWCNTNGVEIVIN